MEELSGLGKFTVRDVKIFADDPSSFSTLMNYENIMTIYITKDRNLHHPETDAATAGSC